MRANWSIQSHDPMIKFTYTVRAILAIAFLLYFPSISEAQVTVFTNDHTVQPGETFTVDVSAQGFQEILTCQFSVSWDSMAFEFRGTDNLNEVFEDYPLDHFGFAQISEGKLGFSWIDFSLAGVSVEDDSVLFSIRLKVLQEESEEFTFGFGGDPTAIEVADVEENILDVEFQGGSIIIDGISNNRNKNKPEFVQVNSFPNPFKEATKVDINFLHSTSAHITIHDVLGATLYEESASYQSGVHTLDLSRTMFPQSGTYYLKIQSEDFLITRKLIVI